MEPEEGPNEVRAHRLVRPRRPRGHGLLGPYLDRPILKTPGPCPRGKDSWHLGQIVLGLRSESVGPDTVPLLSPATHTFSVLTLPAAPGTDESSGPDYGRKARAHGAPWVRALCPEPTYIVPT